MRSTSTILRKPYSRGTSTAGADRADRAAQLGTAVALALPQEIEPSGGARGTSWLMLTQASSCSPSRRSVLRLPPAGAGPRRCCHPAQVQAGYGMQLDIVLVATEQGQKQRRPGLPDDAGQIGIALAWPLDPGCGGAGTGLGRHDGEPNTGVVAAGPRIAWPAAADLDAAHRPRRASRRGDYRPR